VIKEQNLDEQPVAAQAAAKSEEPHS